MSAQERMAVAQNAGMRRVHLWRVSVLLALVLLLVAGVLVLRHWVGADDLRQRAEVAAEQALGVSVKIGHIGLSVWPLPAVVLEDIRLGTRAALTLGQVEVRPDWVELLFGRVAPSTLIVRNAVLPQSAIDALVTAIQKKRRGAATKDADAGSVTRLLPHGILLDRVTWVDDKGAGMMVKADAHLSLDALPQELQLEILKGRLQGARLSLQRDGLAWEVALQIAGGSVKGRVELQPGAEFAFKGQLQTRDVEVSALTSTQASDKTTQPLSGQLEASTTLSVRTRSASGVLAALQTQSSFTVRKAVLHGIDLERAVKSVGMSRGGDTRLETLSGQVRTRGKLIEFSNLAASSGALSTTGQVNVAANRELSGRINVSLGGAVGVPLLVGGTLDVPEVQLTQGAKIGAALGTLLLPGAGTGAGVAVGGKVDDSINKLFGK
jgi:uncharacterized protein involved in outer membrane biogenesis